MTPLHINLIRFLHRVTLMRLLHVTQLTLPLIKPLQVIAVMLSLVAATLIVGCEVYQSPSRQCIKNPKSSANCRGLTGLTVNPSKDMGANAKKHCLFKEEDVVPIRKNRVPQQFDGLRSWKNTNFVNVEVPYGHQTFNCVFAPAELPKDIYIPLTYELVDWLTQEEGK